ncbi:hypothetical protein [Kitasatospora sp. NPDC050543]|uniref:hypothetical protein n=1 Tax=Kitasatospora sp. NPDC050543 TaxID=3364054 RepID=UPI003797A149
MTDGEHRLPPLRAGRRPAGAALLRWLDDERSPRLCRVSGSPGAGKSHLLAWLVLAGTTPSTPRAQRVHAVLPAKGLSLHGAVWMLAYHLGVVARTPQELLVALEGDARRTVVCVPEIELAADPVALVTELLDPLLELEQVRLLVDAPTGSPAAAAFTAVPQPAVLDLDDPGWTDRARFESWCLKAGGDPARYPNPGAALGGSAPVTPEGLAALAARIPVRPDGSPDLVGAGQELLSDFWAAAAREGGAGRLQGDPLLLALAGPVTVTAALEGEDGTVARAWYAAGPGLIEESDPAARAAILRTRLLGVDEAAAARLATVPAPWGGVWAHWEAAAQQAGQAAGQLAGRSGWPGPVTALAPGQGPYAGLLLLADPSGAVRVVEAGAGRPQGAAAVPAPQPLRALAVTPGGTVVLLDARGGTELLPPAQPAPGLAPAALEEALGLLRAGAGAELSALTAVPGLPDAAPALGDVAGAVHWVEPGGAVRSERLHTGPVTALAGAALGGDGGADPGFPALVSGGFDGTVRLWGPGSEPMAEPADSRGCPVTAVAVAATPAGPVVAAAWSDGQVRVRYLSEPDGVWDLRLGSQVWSLALVGELLVLGLPDGLVAVRITRG